MCPACTGSWLCALMLNTSPVMHEPLKAQAQAAQLEAATSGAVQSLYSREELGGSAV